MAVPAAVKPTMQAENDNPNVLFDQPNNEQNSGVQIAQQPIFGMRPSSANQQKPRATGLSLVHFDCFLVGLKFKTVLPPYPGLPSSTELNGAKVAGEKIKSSKMEPHLVYGSANKGTKGFNQQFIPDARIPVMLWFPKGTVKENDSLKATQIKVQMNNRGVIHEEVVYFFEYTGGKTLEQQIKEFKAEYKIEA